MISFFQRIIVETVKRRFKNKKIAVKQFEKEVKSTKVEFRHVIHDSFFILIGILASLLLNPLINRSLMPTILSASSLTLE